MLGSIVAGVIAPLVWGSTLSLACCMAVFLVLGFCFRTAYRRRLVRRSV
jgi:DHA1 family bicyclomycin/chloramphenicol resistance-like MFS transporter